MLLPQLNLLWTLNREAEVLLEALCFSLTVAVLVRVLERSEDLRSRAMKWDYARRRIDVGPCLAELEEEEGCWAEGEACYAWLRLLALSLIILYDMGDFV
jgi:hypothetical protein